MPVHVAFLRAINLGNRRRYPMSELVACLEADGFTDVATHLATGNVRVGSRMRSNDRVARRLEELFEADRGFRVDVAALAAPELPGVLADAESLTGGADPPSAQFVTFLVADPDPDRAAGLAEWSDGHEHAALRGRVLHWWTDGGYSDSTLGAGLEKRLGVPGTTRTLRVVRTLAERWGSRS